MHQDGSSCVMNDHLSWAGIRAFLAVKIIREGPALARKLLPVNAIDARRRHPEMQEEFLTEARESNQIRSTGVPNEWHLDSRK
jgi:hypothetical protein